jgi:oligopeptide transport system ATP-binding protein
MSSSVPNGSFFAVRDLVKYFPVRKGLFRKTTGHVKAVDGVSFEVEEGSTLGLVGESGCGKTTTARLILHLEKPDSGQILIEGEDTVDVRGAQLAAYRRRVQLIFQDPYSSLNPHKKIGQIVGEPYIINRVCSRREVRDRVASMLELVNLPADWMKRYPHEMSGGQRQRVGIARALTLDPRILVCDEPVSALDVSIRSQIINLLIDLQEKLGLTYLFIAHDLSLVEHVSDQVAIMYLGKIVEQAPARELFEGTLHPYSEALLSAVPVPDPGRKRDRIVLSGDVPSPMNPPSGCRFRTRCPIARDVCSGSVGSEKGHRNACNTARSQEGTDECNRQGVDSQGKVSPALSWRPCRQGAFLPDHGAFPTGS